MYVRLADSGVLAFQNRPPNRPPWLSRDNPLNRASIGNNPETSFRPSLPRVVYYTDSSDEESGQPSPRRPRLGNNQSSAGTSTPSTSAAPPSLPSVSIAPSRPAVIVVPTYPAASSKPSYTAASNAPSTSTNTTGASISEPSSRGFVVKS
uniref:Uncharacterized protein n=1 Tax=Graphocephala atropunctata TaxID=36148 RepID=A0A1B6M127_9HEMI